MRTSRKTIQDKIEAIERIWGFTDSNGYNQVPLRAKKYAAAKDVSQEDALKYAYMAYGQREALQSLIY